MTTVVIQKGKVQKGEFVLVPKREYEELVTICKAIRLVQPTASEKRAIANGKKELRSGKFFTLDELDSYVDRARTRTRR